MKSKLINCFLLIVLLIWNYKYCLGNIQKYEVEVELWKYTNYYAKIDCHHDRLDCKISLDMKVVRSFEERHKILYKTNWMFPNVFGFTKKGVHDSREGVNLTVIHKFNVELQNLNLYVGMDASLQDKSGKVLYKYPFDVNLKENGTVRFKSLSGSKVNTTIEIKATFTCQKNYFGKYCTKYCHPVPNYFSCHSNGERKCVDEKWGKNCNQFRESTNICANISSCSCENDKIDKGIYLCTQNYLQCSEHKGLCKQANFYCKYYLESLEYNCQKPQVKTKSNYMDIVKYSVIGIGIFFFIILIMVIYRSKRNKRNEPEYVPTSTFGEGVSLVYEVIKNGPNNNNNNRELPPPLAPCTDNYVWPQSHYENVNKSKNSGSANYINQEVIEKTNGDATTPPLPPRYFKIN